MEKEIREKLIIPETPKVIPNEQLMVYIPIATIDNPGIASYDSTYFEIVDGKVMLKTAAIHGSSSVILGKMEEIEGVKYFYELKEGSNSFSDDVLFPALGKVYYDVINNKLYSYTGREYNLIADLTIPSDTNSNLRNAESQGSIEQVYGPEDDQHSTAYQVGSVAFGGKTQAGMTEEEFLEEYPSGVDGTGRTWAESYAFATSLGDLTKARGRASIASGSASEANGYNAGSFGRHCVVDANNSYAFGFELISKHSNDQIVIGKYNLNKDYSIFEVGNGTETKRSNAIEVDKNGRIYCYLTEAGKNTNWYGDILTREEVEEYLQDKVSTTDYATGDVAGIVRVRDDRGIRVNTASTVRGLVELVPAREDEKVKELTNRAWYKPITAGILDKAIVVGISTNTITLTEGEKTSACDWLGVTEKFAPALAPTTGRLQVYTSDGTSSRWETIMTVPNVQKTPGVIPVYVSKENGTAANETTKGYLVSNYPVNAYHVATKDYVDNQLQRYHGRPVVSFTWEGELAANQKASMTYLSTSEPLTGLEVLDIIIKLKSGALVSKQIYPQTFTYADPVSDKYGSDWSFINDGQTIGYKIVSAFSPSPTFEVTNYSTSENSRIVRIDVVAYK